MGFFSRKSDSFPMSAYSRPGAGLKTPMRWMEKSSHLFHPDDTELIEQHLINELSHIKAEVINL